MFRTVSPESVGISSSDILTFIKTLDRYHFCTHSILMARGHDIFAEGYYAPFHQNTKQRMYSVSKSFVSVAVGLAIEDGLLKLDDNMMQFFPEYTDEHTNSLLMDMTIKEVLTMETCKGKRTDWFTSGTQDRCEVYFREAADRISGTIWTYDSPASFMLTAIIEKLTQKPFLEYLRERFLRKAGFSEDSYCLQCPGGYSFGDSGILCTTRDLLTFARFVMDGGQIDGVRYMNENYLHEATSRQVSTDHDGSAAYNSYGYGYQIWKAPNDGFAFIGMGDQFAICDREKDFIFIITSDNQGHAPQTRTLLYHLLYDTIISKLGDPLPDNNEAFDELTKYLKGVELFSLADAHNSPYSAELNGRTYLLDENPMGIEYVHFDLAGTRGILTYKNKQGLKTLPFGFGYNELSEFPEENYSDQIATIPVPGHRYDCAVSADWPEEKKLRLKIQIIDTYLGNASMEFGFKDNSVGIFMTKNAEAFLEEYHGYANGHLININLGGLLS